MARGIIIKVTTTDVMRRLRTLARDDAPVVTAYALTKSGQDIKAAEIATMKALFDRSTRFALNALFLRPATKRELVAIVYFKDGSARSRPRVSWDRRLTPASASTSRTRSG